MAMITGHSINMSIQEAFEDAVRHAIRSKNEEVHESVKFVEVRRIYAERTAEGSFRNLFVEIEAT